jgi:ATP-dependent RNA helicase DDX49/DBP8
MATFESLGLDRWVADQCQALHLRTPTHVQQQCIPQILQGARDIVGVAPTGSGKTAAFALPILHDLSGDAFGVFAVVLTPSRELAFQIVDQFRAFGAAIGIRVAVVVGGMGHSQQLAELQERPHIVVGTPGRLAMLARSFPGELKACMSRCRYFVLDEIDRLMETEALSKDTLDAMSALAKYAPPRAVASRRWLVFTATPCDAVTEAGSSFWRRVAELDGRAVVPVVVGAVADGAVDSSAPSNKTHEMLLAPLVTKLATLTLLLRASSARQAVVFTNSCQRCEIVRRTLQLLGFPVCSLNATLTQRQRLRSLALFKAGISKFLVATDVASRGLDIPAVDLVVNYDFPKLSSTYVHRAGRAGRAGEPSVVVSLVVESEGTLVRRTERKAKVALMKCPPPAGSSSWQDAVVSILDDVSEAKIEAKLQLSQDATQRTPLDDETRKRRNAMVRTDGAVRRARDSDE